MQYINTKISSTLLYVIFNFFSYHCFFILETTFFFIQTSNLLESGLELYHVLSSMCMQIEKKIAHTKCLIKIF